MAVWQFPVSELIAAPAITKNPAEFSVVSECGSL